MSKVISKAQTPVEYIAERISFLNDKILSTPTGPERNELTAARNELLAVEKQLKESIEVLLQRHNYAEGRGKLAAQYRRSSIKAWEAGKMYGYADSMAVLQGVQATVEQHNQSNR
jgi:hypothetical protein